MYASCLVFCPSVEYNGIISILLYTLYYECNLFYTVIIHLIEDHGLCNKVRDFEDSYLLFLLGT